MHEVRGFLGSALALSARAAWPLVRTLLAGFGLVGLLLVPPWVWVNLAVRVLAGSPQQLTSGDAVRLVAAVAVPTVAVLLAALLATWAGAVVVLDDVAAGRRPRAVRAVGRGVRALPRLAVTALPALLAVVALVVAAPVVVVVGLVLVPVTLVGRRLRPEARWPDRRTLTTLVVPFGAAATCGARWLALPALVVLERSGPADAFRASPAMAGARTPGLAVALGSLVAGVLALGWGTSLLLDARGAGQAWQDAAVAVAQALLLVVAAAMAVRVFSDAGGVAGPAPDPTPPRVVVAAAIAFALVAQLAPMAVAVPHAGADGVVVPGGPGAPLVVDDLGDAGDAAPGDGTCATDAGTCTLRAAVDEANTSTDRLIAFTTSGTITLGSPLHLAKPVTIDGAGADITVSGGGTTSVFLTQMEVPGGGYGAIRNLVIADGYEPSTGGAALYNSGTSAGFTLDGVTVRDHTVPAGAMFGGAVVNLSKLTITNSTFAGNAADPTVDGSDVANRFSGQLTVTASTFTGATGSSSLSSDGESADVRGSIVAGGGFACSGPFTGAGNVTTDTEPICPGAVATPAQLALEALADNGGDTPTVRLGPASVAIDAGDPAACPATDQRGRPRPQGGACDAGAYEFDPATTTALSVTPSASSFGDSVSLGAQVAPRSEPRTIPTGAVRFSDGGAPLGDAPVDPETGTASLDVATLAAGDHTLTATYLPDTAFATSTSEGVAHTVETAGTAVSLTSSSSTTLAGEPVTFTIEVTAPGSTPTGSVALFDGLTELAALGLDGEGRATFTTSSLAGGPHTLAAAYFGDAGHWPAVSPPLGHAVVAGTTTALAGPGEPTVYGTPAAFEVAVTPTGGGATPTGTVALAAGELDLGEGTLDAEGRATIEVSSLPPGTHPVTARYGGDGYNATSTSPAASHQVTAAETQVELTVTPGQPTPFGTTVAVQATVTAAGTPATPTGSITFSFSDGAGTTGAGGLDETGTATYSTAELDPGTYQVRADYFPGTGFEAGSSAEVPHTVVPATTALELTASAPSSTFGQAVTLQATATTLDSPRTATGTVTFHDGATVLGTAALEGGTASLATPAIAVGARTLTATLDGGSRFAPATSPDLAHHVQAAGVTVALTDDPDPSVFGGTVALEVSVAAVAPGAGVPTGTVTVREGATTLVTLTLDAEGRATTDLGGLAVGTHQLTADYAGDGSFAPGSVATTHVVAPGTATVGLSSSAPDARFTDPVTFTAVVTGTGTATPTGTVTFKDGDTVLGAAPLDAEGVARLTTTALRTGTYLVTAGYSGDDGFGAATGWVTQDVDPAGTATSLAVDPAAPTVADLVTLTATVAGTSTAVVPAGTVTFYDGEVALATVPLGADGQAATSRAFGRAVHTLRAAFTGPSGWAPSTSSPVELVPARAPSTIALAGAPTSVAVGGSVTWTATLALAPLAPAPTGTIRFWSGPAYLGEGPITGGVATLTVPAPAAVGPWPVVATYDGDHDHELASSPEASVQVAAASTSVTPVAPSASWAAGTIELGAQVASPLVGTPLTGVVRFTADSPGFAPQVRAVDATGWAALAVTGVPAGDWVLTATFEPSSTAVFAGSSATTPLVVVRRPATLTLSAPPEATVGQELVVDFSVLDGTGTGPSPAGTVTVSGGGTQCSAPVSAGRCRLPVTSPGTLAVTATSSGDATYEPATAGPVVVTARGATPTLTAWTPTATWVTGDPATITWQLDGPTQAEVVVRTPFGEACRSTTVPLGSCTVTFPFEQRGQVVPVDVSYAGDDGWSAASATVTGTVVGCYRLSLAVVPAEAGSLTRHPDGNCNAGAGTLAGTQVGVAVQPTPPYVLDRWLEDGSTARAYSFTVGDGATTATAQMAVPCTEVWFGRGEAFDLGPLASMGGHVEATAPNCPTDPAVHDEAGGSRAAYLPGTEVTFTAVPARPAVDEAKLWVVDGEASRATQPLALVVGGDDVRVEARFGVRCARPTFTSLGGGTIEAFTPDDCVDAAGDTAWQQGSTVGARITPDAYRWVAGYGDHPPVRETTSPFQHPTALAPVPQVHASWIASDDLHVQVSFETCRQLTLEPRGPGRVDATTAPNCPTRLAHEGLWYRPGTRVDVRATPDPPSTRTTNQRGADGELRATRTPVEPYFRGWDGVERPSWWDQATVRPPDEPTAFVDLATDRTVRADFFDAGRCMAFVPEVVPAGAAQLQVAIRGDEGRCPEGEADLYDVAEATFLADPVADAPRVAWAITTTDDDTDESVELLVENDGAPVPIKNRTFATAYVCVGIDPQITLIAPDGSEVTGSPPAGADFVSTDTDPDCPIWENAYTVGSDVTLVAAAPPEGYEFSHWEGDVGGREPDVAVRLDGSQPTVVARAVYRVRCVTVSFAPGGARVPEVSPQPNCPGGPVPGEPALAGNQMRFIGGTTVLMDAKKIDNHDFNGWGGEGLLDREAMLELFTQSGMADMVALVGAMDHPAMVTADFDMTVHTDYVKHSVGKQISDDLAVTGKKIIGVLSLITVGVFEGFTIGLARLAVSAASLLTKWIDPGATDVVKLLDQVQNQFDLLELGFLCIAQWSRGSTLEGPGPDNMTGNGVTPPTNKQVVATGLKAANEGRKLGGLIKEFRALKPGGDFAGYVAKVPPPTSAVDKLKAAGSKLKGLGVVTVGTAIFKYVSDGPGVVWEDTAAQAWNTGAGPFEDCVHQELHEAFPDDIPPLPPKG